MVLVLALSACANPPVATPAPTPVASAVSKPPAFVGRMWRQTAPADAPLGTAYVFFADGALLQTSCVEVYRLSTWRPDGERALTITEEPHASYSAEIETVGERGLRMRFRLGGEWRPWKTLEAASAPFVCPDLPK
jgi:hypothetical protein